MSNITMCILDETKICDQCQDCLICSIDPNKKCDNCCACLDESDKDYETIFIEEIIIDENVR